MKQYFMSTECVNVVYTNNNQVDFIHKISGENGAKIECKNTYIEIYPLTKNNIIIDITDCYIIFFDLEDTESLVQINKILNYISDFGDSSKKVYVIKDSTAFKWNGRELDICTKKDQIPASNNLNIKKSDAQSEYKPGYYVGFVEAKFKESDTQSEGDLKFNKGSVNIGDDSIDKQNEGKSFIRGKSRFQAISVVKMLKEIGESKDKEIEEYLKTGVNKNEPTSESLYTIDYSNPIDFSEFDSIEWENLSEEKTYDAKDIVCIKSEFKELCEFEKKRKTGEIVIFFKYKKDFDIIPITITADKLIVEALYEYIKKSNKQNVKFKSKGKELKINDISGRRLYELEGLVSG